jgi:maleylpyruvate isomerase
MAGRTDNVTDPELVAALLLARRGQAYFSRQLRELTDDELDAPSRLPGWTRRHVAAHVGFNARAVARLVEWAATGVETPMYSSPDERAHEIDFGATLPPQAIRNLSDHAAIHLNVEWRDLPEERWSFPVVTAQGRTVPVSETVWMRTREVWIHAVDLDNGARFEQFPVQLIDRLLVDLIAVWNRKRTGTTTPNIVLEPSDRAQVLRLDPVSGADELIVHGTAVELVGWGTGRMPGTVKDEGGRLAPTAPPWL